MKKLLLFLLILLLLLSGLGAFGQVDNKGIVNPKEISSIPGSPDSSLNKSLCICRIVSFTTDDKQQRTDAIFAASTSENQVSRKELRKNIQDELRRAMLFFYSYKTVKQYAAKVDCSTLFAELKEKYENISRFTVLLPSYAAR